MSPRAQPRRSAAIALPSPEELRERADAARDEADRLAAVIHALEIRITTASNELRMAQFGAAMATPHDPERIRRLRLLVEQRQLLSRGSPLRSPRLRGSTPRRR